MTVKYFLLLGRRDFKLVEIKEARPCFNATREKKSNKWMAFGNLLPQIHWTNCNQLWQNASLGTSIE